MHLCDIVTTVHKKFVNLIIINYYYCMYLKLTPDLLYMYILFLIIILRVHFI